MNFNQLINQVLGAAKQYGDKAAQSDTLTKLGGGAAVAGLLSMFLKKGKGQRIAHAGSMAALGALAYAAYQKYQQNQSAGNTAQQAAAAAPLALPETAFEQRQRKRRPRDFAHDDCRCGGGRFD